LLFFFQKLNINYKIFDYVNRYSEKDYIDYLKQSKYGIWLGAHESQGFALEEALSCDVPLLVWNVRYMSQEYGSKYNDIPATTIPYWDNRCGEYFYEYTELENAFNEFIKKIETYKPREYILENLSIKKCKKKIINLINNI
jgi:glycosyltransferase involved in cell wall biosynthesis